MHIRPARHEDIPAIAAVQAASWKNAYRGMLSDRYLEDEVSHDLLRHWQAVEIRSSDVVLVTEEVGEIVGFIAIWCNPEPFIDNLHVLPRWRSKGMGRLLMQAATQKLIRLGHSTAYLWVLEENRRAREFYEGLGGVCVERADKPIFEHALPCFKIAWTDLLVIPQGSHDGSKAKHNPPDL